jgi:hypothetical protein
LTGTHVRNEISLDIRGFGLWQGTVTQDILSLRIPQSDGTIQVVAFHRGGTGEYNADVGSLQQIARDTEASVNAANAETARAQQESAAKSNLARDIDSLRSAVTSISNTLRDYDAAATQGMNDALSQLRQTLSARPLDCGQVSYQLGTVDYARGVVKYMSGSLDYVIMTVNDMMSSVSEDMIKVQLLDPSADLASGRDAVTSANTAIANAMQGAQHDDELADAAVSSARQLAKNSCP